MNTRIPTYIDTQKLAAIIETEIDLVESNAKAQGRMVWTSDIVGALHRIAVRLDRSVVPRNKIHD